MDIREILYPLIIFIKMIKKLITILLLILVSYCVSATTDIRISSLGHENYGIELCGHDSSCVYYSANTTMSLSALNDYTIKIVDKQEDKFSLHYFETLNYNIVVENIALILMGLAFAGLIIFTVTKIIIKR